jgi:cytoskeletal protein RodZ
MESFGLLARRQRESRRMTLEDVSSSTKIAVRYLHAIELEELARLPGGIITRGFVRAYAKCIGLDEAQGLQDFLASSESSNEHRVTPAPMREALFTRCCDRVMRLPLWSLAACFVAIGFGLMTLGSELRDFYESVREPSLRQALPSEPLPVPSQQGDINVGQSSHLPTRAEDSRHTLKSVLQQTSSAAPASAAFSKSQAFTVRIKAREDAWMSVRADGRLIFSETLIASTEKLLEAHEYIVIRAGNIGAVDFYFNGRILPPQGAYDEAKTLNFDTNGLQLGTADSGSQWRPTQIPMAQVSIEH